ncbi:MAG: pyridoxal-5'-phosphate-dependent protein subunit beta [Bdellovibrionales bacterium CG12_big_fil_rev_8_21_14_0_65_38_15]|nr:MAG: pyridoxal-5'-phosphate-dependent protein subunit beta [Bdellovibrionales bacterium CG22_combo_CG10-13_8_21_14_all_38_13]PIQ54519.1 MAG: pyridoxal-5'-phosphate-dependent protein subunit beta [Bdellovibrionales bacterium CG12_big_fil_rev_8_21_14_0_65_38_15]PIR29900.1 MAG: pyridoxal-5'-phosphate-dependent protein subunit beta [Bdellovibrionales bacterium CG11_big_fil_rev_8_21_14_0_20_38_13]
MMKGTRPNILQAIGGTPIVKLNKVTSEVESEIYVKLEYMNPGGSTKDRIGAYMLDQAVKEGTLKPGGTIIEGTSGNTGVGLAMWAAVHGYKCIFVMADKQSQEKISNLKAFGAKVVVCPTNVEPDDPRSYYSVSKRLSATIPNSFYVNQYDNLHNRDTHYTWTAPEMYEQTGGDFDTFMATVGTGGTISGCGRYFKEKMPNVKIIGIDCEGSIVAEFAKTGKMGQARPYVLEGVGEDFIPENYDFKNIDDWVVIGDKESFLMTRRLLKHEGIYAGGSAGAAIVGAIKYAKTLKKPEKILVLLHDSGNRYASKIYNDDWMSTNNYLDSSFSVQIRDVLLTLGKGKEIFSVSDTATIGEAIKMMEEKGISYLPVVDKGIIKGLVSEKNLVRPVLLGEFSQSDNISLATHQNFRIVDENELLENVANALLKKEIALVTRNDKLIDILTEIDVLQYMAKKEAL